MIATQSLSFQSFEEVYNGQAIHSIRELHLLTPTDLVGVAHSKLLAAIFVHGFNLPEPRPRIVQIDYGRFLTVIFTSIAPGFC